MMNVRLEDEPYIGKPYHGKTPRTYYEVVQFFFEHAVRGENPDDCWKWTGPKCNGYAMVHYNGRYIKASRLSWEIHSGLPLKKGFCMCHSCNNPPCCNPRHVTPDTHDNNMRWKTKCGRDNHPFGDALATKLTSEKVVQMRIDYATGLYSLKQLGEKYGCSKTSARYIVHGLKWRSAGGPIAPIKPELKDEFSDLPMSGALRYYYRRIKKEKPV